MAIGLPGEWRDRHKSKLEQMADRILQTNGYTVIGLPRIIRKSKKRKKYEYIKNLPVNPVPPWE